MSAKSYHKLINQSRLTAGETHAAVSLHLFQLGWLPTNAAEEEVYDISVDVGLISNKRLFLTIQVKFWDTVKTCSRPGISYEKENRIMEQVSVGGKPRNHYWYYDVGVDYIATVKPDVGVIFWPKEVYQHLGDTQLKNTVPVEFPYNKGVYPYEKPSPISTTQTNSSLLPFLQEAS